MKITCLKKDLEKALIAAQKIISKNSNLPVLENVLFEARGDELYIKATNIEVFFEYRITVSLENDGEFIVPPEILLQAIKGSSDNNKIVLELKNNELHVDDGTGKVKIKTINNEDFPKIKKPEKLKETNNYILKDLLLSGIKATLPFSSNLTIKPELSSVYIYKDNGDLVFVATDHFRLAEKRVKFDIDEFESILIPNKNAAILVKVLETVEDEKFKILSEENQLSLQSENMFLSSRILDLSFPDYKVIIPTECDATLFVLKSDILSTLKKSAVFTDKFGATEISLSNNKLKIKSQNSDIGEIEEYVDTKADGSLDCVLKFNNRFLQEGISSINEDTVKICVSCQKDGALKPLLIEAVEDKSFIYIVMPMNN